MLSAAATVASRCATTTRVCPPPRPPPPAPGAKPSEGNDDDDDDKEQEAAGRARAERTAASVAESRADVASSQRMSRARLSRQRAMATRCFSPPDSLRPRSPTRVASPSGRRAMVEVRPAASIAWSSCWWVASGLA
mmetsp:Transcript_52143/g.136285  ORF Transcript_52143/g.136285 Transcript_52143/m.136285 type:complete len:136 (+) Transcript_52143:404-811(+)